jgi:hypothetical protein
MSERKYRQRGYQDESRPREAPREKRAPEPRAPGRSLQDAEGPRTPRLMASHEVFRCSRCGRRLPLPVEADSRCDRCGTDIHSCIHCASFDTSARWECSHPQLAARVAPKDERNTCAFFEPRTTVERQTGTAGQAPTNSARQAFDDLFK